MEGFDYYSGRETMHVDNANGRFTTSLSANDFHDRVFSFIVWWDKDFEINETWKIDPYLGWRTVDVQLEKMNDFANPNDPKHDSSVVHLVSGGLKFKYNSGPLGMYFRAGVNHRLRKDPVPGFASRAVAPSVVNLGFMSNWDRTVATYGLGINYFLPSQVVLDFSYNGAAGSNTTLHTFGAAIVFLY
jgi:hypothetical protein